MKLPKAEQDLEEWQTAVEAGRRSQRPDHDGAHRYDEGAQSAGGRFVTLGLTRDISSKSASGRAITFPNLHNNGSHRPLAATSIQPHR
jgi:hypothetical protein